MTKQVAQDGGAPDLDAIEARANAHACALPCDYCRGTGNASDEYDSEGEAMGVVGPEDVIALVNEMRRLHAMLAPVQDAARAWGESLTADTLMSHGPLTQAVLRAALSTIGVKDGDL